MIAEHDMLDTDPAVAPRDAAAERMRLAHLDRLGVLDTPPDPGLDRIVDIVSTICAAPIVLVSLIDASRQWFMARTGLDARETPREWAFCDHALCQKGILEVRDPVGDPRFRSNPLVTGAPFIRFYAGAPIRLNDGTALGTLCVIDTSLRPDGLTPTESRLLLAHAALVADRLHLMGSHARLRQQIDLSSRVQARLADMVAVPGRAVPELVHELRTPLCSIMGYAALIAVDPMVPAEPRKWAGAIDEGGRWMLKLVNTLLDTPSAGRRGDAAALGATDLREPLDAALRLVHGLALDAGLRLDVRMGAAPLPMRADPATVQQIAVNLLANAIKYTASGGTVWLDLLSEPAGTVGFSISDDGPGVAPERVQGGHGVLAHDLEDPRQLPEASGAETAQKGGSSGMGLRISRRLAEGQGGGLSIVNRPSAGIGFMVRVSLPGA
ncbi:GAF domain-containing sensor histidine kinase (plasmid) [Tistrella bauzanensis]|jgi:signal transduction histidine kinase|uniref:GAF domain-containing sensor histidine kinase n=1 Tax=Tistrella TaxID=171436 RepID=UPI0031F62E90